MSKLAAIIGVGSFYCPWFPWTLASVHFCDEIVVVNGGYNLKDPKNHEYNIPVEQYSKDISELNPLGKIKEILQPTNDMVKNQLMIGTQLDGNKPNWYAASGLNYTLAEEQALKDGCSWILKIDSDQVCYVDACRLKTDLADQSLIAYQWEFARDIWHLSDPGPTTPYHDSIFTHTADPTDRYNGHAVPQIKSHRHLCPDYHSAHLRQANPANLVREAEIDHFRGRIAYSKFVGGNPDYIQADAEARARLDNPSCKLSTIPPPEVCLIPRSNLNEWAQLIARIQLPSIQLGAYLPEEAAGWGSAVR